MKLLYSCCISLIFMASCATQSGSLLAQNPDGSQTLVQNTTEANSIYLSPDGKMGIGKRNPTDKLEVNGQIHARSVKVDLEKWADTVFEKEYNLIPLGEVESYIYENGHLPEIPSAEVVLKNGIELGEMNRLLLQKIEELTLHLIQKEKQLDQLSESVLVLKTQVQKIKSTD